MSRTKSDQLRIIENAKCSENVNTGKCVNEFNSINMEAKESNLKQIPAQQSKKDDRFEEFRRLLQNIRNENNYVAKCALLTDMLTFGCDDVRFQGNIIIWSRFLLPDLNPMIANMKNEELLKIFSNIFDVNIKEMYKHLKKSMDIDNTIVQFYINKMNPFRSTSLTIEQVNTFLSGLSNLKSVQDQENHFREFLPLCTAGDLDCIVKLIRHDLKIDLNSRDILEAIHPDAYSVFVSCTDVILAIKLCFPKYNDLPISTNFVCDVSKDNKFKEFRRLVANIRNENKFANKIELLKDMFTFGSDGVKFQGNIVTWCRLLIPDQNPMICKMEVEKIVKLFSIIFDKHTLELFQHLDQSTSISDTIVHFYSKNVVPSTSKNLTIDQVDEFLVLVSEDTNEDVQVKYFKQILPYCSAGDLDCILLLLRHNLDMGLEPRHILEAAHPNAYTTFLSCGDITSTINKCIFNTLSAVKKPIKPIEYFPKTNTQDVNKTIKSKFVESSNMNTSEYSNKDQFMNKNEEMCETAETEKVDTAKIANIVLRHDNTFEEFREFIDTIRKRHFFVYKIAFLSEMFGDQSKSEDVITWSRLLLPEHNPMIKYVDNDQLIQLFSRIFVEDTSEIYNHFEESNSIDKTIEHFYSKKMDPPSSTTLKIKQVNEFFSILSQVTTLDEQVNHIKKFLPSCTIGDLNCIVKLMGHNLNINLKPKNILEAIHPEAYSSFESSGCISKAIKYCLSNTKILPTQGITLMNVIKNMYVEACRTIHQAIQKFPNGICSELKYPCQVIQLHKKENKFIYFSKKNIVNNFVLEFIQTNMPTAFPRAEDLILICFIRYEKSMSLYVSDCLYLNGVDLTGRPLKERREILLKNMIEIPDVIMFSEMKKINNAVDLAKHFKEATKMGLIGLELQDMNGKYEPGQFKRMYMTKSSLYNGNMTDTANLIVIGGWSNPINLHSMSTILLGVYDSDTEIFYAVAKVYTNQQIDMSNFVNINEDITKTPNWLNCNELPEFIAINPKSQPVWKIGALEFAERHQKPLKMSNCVFLVHSKIISTKTNKNWETATSLDELTKLYHAYRHDFDCSLIDEELKSLCNDSSN